MAGLSVQLRTNVFKLFNPPFCEERGGKSRPPANAEADSSLQHLKDCCQLPFRAKSIFKCFEIGPVNPF